MEVNLHLAILMELDLGLFVSHNSWLLQGITQLLPFYCAKCAQRL